MKHASCLQSVLLSMLVGTACGQSGSTPPAQQSPVDASTGEVVTTFDAPSASTGGAIGSGGAPSGSGGATGGAPGPIDADGTSGPIDADGTPERPPAADVGGSGAPGAPCSAMFCESFEDVADGAPPNPAIWSRTSNDLVVDSTRAARGGKKALHIPPTMSGSKYIRENKTLATMGSAFYGRMYFWIERQPLEKPPRLYHWTLLEADERDSVTAGRVLRLGGHIEGSGTNWLRFNFETHGNPGETGLSDQSAVLATKRWYCVEFYFSLPDNEARFWLDGVENPKLHWKGPMGAYTFPSALAFMSFGWAEYQATGTPWELWIDEIALDTKKIGCN